MKSLSDAGGGLFHVEDCSNSSRAEVKWLSQQVVGESAWEVVIEDVVVVVF